MASSQSNPTRNEMAKEVRAIQDALVFTDAALVTTDSFADYGVLDIATYRSFAAIVSNSDAAMLLTGRFLRPLTVSRM